MPGKHCEMQLMCLGILIHLKSPGIVRYFAIGKVEIKVYYSVEHAKYMNINTYRKYVPEIIFNSHIQCVSS